MLENGTLLQEIKMIHSGVFRIIRGVYLPDDHCTGTSEKDK